MLCRFATQFLLFSHEVHTMHVSKFLSFAFCSLAVVLITPQIASAQRGGGFGGQALARFQLASLPEVQSELKLTDELKSLAKTSVEDYREEVQAIMQDSQGDFQGAQSKITDVRKKLESEFTAKLDDAQKSRLTGLFVQAAGPNAVFDEEVMKVLEISDEQKDKLEKVREENRSAMMAAFQDFQSMSQDERREAQGKLRDEANERILSALTDDQKKKLEEVKGAELAMDTSSLRPRGPGR